mgnify:CR=1 FL=1
MKYKLFVLSDDLKCQLTEILEKKVHLAEGLSQYRFRDYIVDGTRVTSLSVCREESRIIGWAVRDRDRIEAYVIESFRRQGIGTQLVQLVRSRTIRFYHSVDNPKFWQYVLELTPACQSESEMPAMAAFSTEG